MACLDSSQQAQQNGVIFNNDLLQVTVLIYIKNLMFYTDKKLVNHNLYEPT